MIDTCCTSCSAIVLGTEVNGRTYLLLLLMYLTEANFSLPLGISSVIRLCLSPPRESNLCSGYTGARNVRIAGKVKLRMTSGRYVRLYSVEHLNCVRG